MNNDLARTIRESARYINSCNADLRNQKITNQQQGQYVVSVHNLRTSREDGEDFTVSYAPHNETVVHGFLLNAGIEARLKQYRDKFYIKYGDNMLNSDSDWKIFPTIILHGKALENLATYHDDSTKLKISEPNSPAYYLHINL